MFGVVSVHLFYGSVISLTTAINIHGKTLKCLPSFNFPQTGTLHILPITAMMEGCLEKILLRYVKNKREEFHLELPRPGTV